MQNGPLSPLLVTGAELRSVAQFAQFAAGLRASEQPESLRSVPVVVCELLWINHRKAAFHRIVRSSSG